MANATSKLDTMRVADGCTTHVAVLLLCLLTFDAHLALPSEHRWWMFAVRQVVAANAIYTAVSTPGVVLFFLLYVFFTNYIILT